MPSDQHRLVGYAIGAAIFVLILSLRMRRMMQHRPFDLKFVWVAPAILIAMAALAFSARPPVGVEWAWVVASFAIGAGLGWLRAKTITLTVDPETHQVMARGTPLAMLFLVGLFVVRFGLRSLLQGESGALGLSVGLIDNAFLAMAAGLFATRAVEMGLRARTLLIQAPATPHT
jgi:NAD/NADP transhydrogenase beta subunit